jgi:hypothetical protein
MGGSDVRLNLKEKKKPFFLLDLLRAAASVLRMRYFSMLPAFSFVA